MLTGDVHDNYAAALGGAAGHAGLFGTAPAVGTQGNEKRNSFRNPSYMDFDASMLKNNRLFGEKVNLQLRFDFFNVLNHVNLGGVDGSMFSSTFGKVTSTGDPRNIQLGARISF